MLLANRGIEEIESLSLLASSSVAMEQKWVWPTILCISCLSELCVEIFNPLLLVR